MTGPHKFHCFAFDLGCGKHALHEHDFAVMLTNQQPKYTDFTTADIVEIPAGNGYAAGGQIIGNSEWIGNRGICKLAGDAVCWPATGNGIGPWRWAVIYNATTKALVSWLDNESAITVKDGESLTILAADDGWISGMAM